MLTFILTLPTPAMPFQGPSWCCALAPTSVCSEQTDRWSKSCADCARAATALGLDAMCGTAPNSLGHPPEGAELCTRRAGGTKEEFAHDAALAQSRWSHVSCDKPPLNCRCACSLRARLGQDSYGSYCTGFVPYLVWELPRLSNSRNKPAAGEERYCFPAFCAASMREWLYFLKIKTPKKTKQKCQKLCALIDQLQCDTSAAGSVFMFPPTPYIAILSTRVICEDGSGENTHRVSMSLRRRRNRCVLSNPQQLDLLGINVFPLLLFGILVFFIQHDPMVCNWIEIHTMRIAITKAYLRRIAWTTCHLKGDVYRINTFSSLNYLQK